MIFITLAPLFIRFSYFHPESLLINKGKNSQNVCFCREWFAFAVISFSTGLFLCCPTNWKYPKTPLYFYHYRLSSNDAKFNKNKLENEKNGLNKKASPKNGLDKMASDKMASDKNFTKIFSSFHEIFSRIGAPRLALMKFSL